MRTLIAGVHTYL